VGLLVSHPPIKKTKTQVHENQRVFKKPQGLGDSRTLDSVLLGSWKKDGASPKREPNSLTVNLRRWSKKKNTGEITDFVGRDKSKKETRRQSPLQKSKGGAVLRRRAKEKKGKGVPTS